jgi:hypothetical protein
MAFLMASTIVITESCFARSDQRKAIAIVLAPGPGGRSLGEGLGPDACRALITSSCRGAVEVTCSSGGGQPYRFAVDLVRKSAAPLDARTRGLLDVALGSMGAPDGGTARDAGDGRE